MSSQALLPNANQIIRLRLGSEGKTMSTETCLFINVLEAQRPEIFGCLLVDSHTHVGGDELKVFGNIVDRNLAFS